MKNILALILGCGISVFIATFFLPRTQDVTSIPVISEVSTKVFQLGAYNTKESAREIASKYNAKVIHSNDYYCVYMSILSDNENIERMTKYLDEQQIKYYIKVVNTDTNFKSTLQQYEELMKKTTSTIAFVELNKRIMDLYEADYAN